MAGPITVAYYYRVRWGALDEFVELFERNHWPILREQLAAIRRELGEGEEGKAEIAELGEAILKARMPKEVEDQARKELRRLEREMAEEAGRLKDLRDRLWRELQERIPGGWVNGDHEHRLPANINIGLAGVEALDVYSDLKTVYINHNPEAV